MFQVPHSHLGYKSDSHKQNPAWAELTFQCGKQTVGSGDIVCRTLLWKCGASPPKSKEKVPSEALKYKVFSFISTFSLSTCHGIFNYLLKKNDRFKMISKNFTIAVYLVLCQTEIPERWTHVCTHEIVYCVFHSSHLHIYFFQNRGNGA